MKKFVILFLLLAAALLALPGYIGMQAEGRYRVMMEQFEKSGLQVASHRYQRSWFGADAETELALPLPQTPPTDAQESKVFRFTLQSALVHGPLLPNGGFGLAEVDTKVLVDGKNVFPADYPALIRTSIALDGAGELLIDLPETLLEAQANRPRIAFKGMKGRSIFDAGFTQADVEATLAGVTISEGSEKSLEISEVSLNSNSYSDASGLMLGDGHFKVDAFELLDMASATSVSLKRIGIDVESSLHNGVVAANIIYQLEAAQIGGENYGPAELKLSVGNLPAAVLLKLQQGMEEVQQLPQEQQPMAMMSVLMGSGPELLQANPKFVIEHLRAKTPEGDIEGHFALQSVGLEWSEIGDFQTVLGKLESLAALRMPESYFKALFAQQARAQFLQHLQMRRQMGEEVDIPDAAELEQLIETAAQAQIDGLLSQEVLVRDGTSLATEATLSNGLLSVNGKVFPLPVPAQ